MKAKQTEEIHCIMFILWKMYMKNYIPSAMLAKIVPVTLVLCS